jgi:hypothetical protein
MSAGVTYHDAGVLRKLQINPGWIFESQTRVIGHV